MGGQDSGHVFIHKGDAEVHHHIQRRGSGPGVPSNEREFVYLEGNINHNANLTIGVNRRDRKSHWGLPEIPRRCTALTGVTRDSDAVSSVQEKTA